MYGFITFIAWGAIYALLPRATGKRPSIIATGLHFWFATVGVTAYVVFLSIGGTEQGLRWAAGDPFIASVEAAAPYWLGRAVAGSLMFLAHIIFAYNVFLMTIGPSAEVTEIRTHTANGARMNRGMNNVWGLIAASALIYGAFCILMGVVPGFVLSDTPAISGLQPLTDAQARGRDVYVSEGCSYCHTQNVRPLLQDKVFGRPSVGGDYAYSTPQLLGTERTGPDLSNVGLRQPSDVWQYIHLWNPRALVHESIMPRYVWLFEVKPKPDEGDVVVPLPPGFGPTGGVVVASQNAQDLVAYLKSLKQVPLGAGGSK